MADPTPNPNALSRREFLEFAAKGLFAIGLAACAPPLARTPQATETPIIPISQPSPFPSPSLVLPKPTETLVPKPTEPPAPQPTPTVEGPTIPGKTLEIGGETLTLKTISGGQLATIVDAEKKGWLIVTDEAGDSSFFTGYAGAKGKEIQVVVLAQGPQENGWDEKNILWRNGQQVTIPDILLPGGWDEGKKMAGPAHEADQVFLLKDNGNYRVGVIYSKEKMPGIPDKSNLQILPDGSGLYVGNPKNYEIKPGQQMTRDPDGNLRLVNSDGNYLLMRTSWENVTSKDQLYQAGAFAGPLESMAEVPYPSEAVVGKTWGGVKIDSKGNVIAVNSNLNDPDQIARAVYDEKKGWTWIAELRPSEKKLTAAIEPYAKVMGLDPKKVATEISYQQLKDVKGNPFYVATTKDGTPFFSATQDQKSGEWRWEKLTLISNVPKPIGTTVDFSDPNYKTMQYEDTVTKNFNFITLTGAFMEEWWNYGGARYWTRWALERNIPFVINNLFFHHDKIPQNLSANQFIDQRLTKVLTTVVSARDEVKKQQGEKFKNIPFRIVLAGEPYYEYQGQIHWQGQYNDIQPYLLYRELGKDWIIEAEAQLIEKAVKLGLKPKVDFEIIGINLPGIEQPGLMTDYTITETIRIKQAVYKRLDLATREKLGISNWKDVPFDVGSEFHLGKTLAARNKTLPIEQFNMNVVNTNTNDVSDKTGSKVHITELDGIGDPIQLAEAMVKLIKGGMFASINFFEPLKPVTDQTNDPWQNILFDANQSPSRAYYYILQKLFNK